MELREWITIGSTTLSPVIAVVVTLWWQSRKERRDGKRHLFGTLMAYRKSYSISYDWANALNLIDVVFSDSSRVISLWHQYYDILNQEQVGHVTTQRNHKFIEMLSAMATELGYKKLQQTDIDKYYNATAHTNLADLTHACQVEWLRVLKNTAKFDVELRSEPETEGRIKSPAA